MSDVADGQFDVAYARGLREAVELAHAENWAEAIPRYTETLTAIAKASSERQGKEAQAAWKAVEAAWEGEREALKAALNAWFRTFIPSKKQG